MATHNILNSFQTPLTDFFKGFNLPKPPLTHDLLAEIFTRNMGEAESLGNISREIFKHLPEAKQIPQMYDELEQFTAVAMAQLVQENGGSEPKMISVKEQGTDVIIESGDGDSEVRTGGTRSWRNNNPGNIRYGVFARNHGAIGEAGGFAVFPDEETGSQALIDLLHTESYQNLTIKEAIARYAPPSENNTLNYQEHIAQSTGFKSDTLLKDLDEPSIRSIADAIRRMEGWRSGNVTNE